MPQPQSQIDRLLPEILCEDPVSCCLALRSLRTLLDVHPNQFSTAIPALISALHGADAVVRFEIASLLSSSASSAHVWSTVSRADLDVLLGMLRDECANVRYVMIGVLAGLRDSEAFVERCRDVLLMLWRLAEEDPSHAVRQQAALKITELTGIHVAGPEDRRLSKALLAGV